MGPWYHSVSGGLGFNGSGSALREGEVFSSSAEARLLFRGSPVDTVSSPEEGLSSPERNPIRADQKLVWSIDLFDGKSMMNLPSWDSSQKFEASASVVQMYVFC